MLETEAANELPKRKPNEKDDESESEKHKAESKESEEIYAVEI